MTNHLRTLLLNRSATGRPAPGWYGEEYIPAEFAPVVLTPALRELHTDLFGTIADDLTLNYKLAQYLQALHSSEAGDHYARQLDPRISYRHASTLLSANYGADIAVVHSHQDMVLEVSGVWNGDTDRGLHYRVLEVYLDGTPTMGPPVSRPVSIIVESVNPPATYADDFAISTADAYSVVANIPLLDTGLVAKVTDPGGIVSKAQWVITLTSRPDGGVPEALDRILKKRGLLDSLTQGDDPYPHFRYLYTHGLTPADKMAGILLTMGWRMEELRQKAGGTN